uniref:RxLR effector protein n=2 Tax=Phytophthora sojae TaxID=67593 RepID=G1FS34_PHYSO|nr:Avh208 [Phytophthora sojae]
MRLSAVLLIVSAAFLASSYALSAEAGAEHRLLRIHKRHHAAAEYKEERGWFDRLPERFKRMKNQHAYREQMFSSWKIGMGTVDEAVSFMKGQGLGEKAIAHFKQTYQNFLAGRSH